MRRGPCRRSANRWARGGGADFLSRAQREEQEEAAERLEVERWSNEVAALTREGVPLREAWSRANEGTEALGHENIPTLLSVEADQDVVRGELQTPEDRRKPPPESRPRLMDDQHDDDDDDES